MTATARAAPRAGSLWRNREFLAIWTGQVVSTMGSRITATALPLLVLALTGSPADAGLVGAAGTLPYLLVHLPAGTLVDRWDRRRVMRVSQGAAALAVASVPVALWLDGLGLPQLVLVAFAQGVCFVFYGLAEEASLPLVVPPALRPAALAQNEAKTRGAALAGPPLGGLLFGLSRAVPFALDAVSYLVAVVGLALLRRPLRAGRTAPPGSLWQDTLAGLRWLWGHRLIRAVTLLVAGSNLIFQAQSLTLIVLARGQGVTSGGIGLMLGIYGGGGFLGALAAGRLHRLFRPKHVVIGTNWIWAGLLPLLAVAPGPVALGAICGASAFIGPLWNVVIGNYLMTLVPDELMGRVNSAAMTLAWGVMPVGSLAAGTLLSTVGPVGTVLVLAAGMLATAIAATASPAVRHADTAPDG